jgi:hypothetical protein
MLFSTKRFDNGKRWGRLEFDTGKAVILKPKELAELETKIEIWKAESRMKEREAKNECLTCGQPVDGDKPCEHIHTA